MTIAASLSAAKDRVQERPNPISELWMRYPFDAGIQPAAPEYLIGTCGSSDQLGALVYISGATTGPNDAAGNPTYAPIFATCDPATPSKAIPVGAIEYKTGDTACVVRTLRGDMAYSGITAGTRYVVGTDGQPAKVGDATYPTGKPFGIGIGIHSGRLLFLPDASGGAAGSSARIATESTAVALAAETDFDRTLTLPANGLSAAGQQLIIEGAVRTGAFAATHTGILKVYVGTLLVFSTFALDPVDAGDVVSFRVVVDVRSVGATGKIVSNGYAACKGDVDGKRSSGGGAGEQTLDTTAAKTIKASWTGSNAGEPAVLQSFRYEVK